MYFDTIPNPPYYMGLKGERIKEAITRTKQTSTGRFIINYRDIGTILSAKDPATVAFLKRLKASDKLIINGERYVMASAVLEKLLNDLTLGFDVKKTQQFEYAIKCLRSLV